jgi:hypothetical protein
MYTDKSFIYRGCVLNPAVDGDPPKNVGSAHSLTMGCLKHKPEESVCPGVFSLHVLGKIFQALIVFSQNYQAPFAGTKSRLPLHRQRSQLGNRLIVTGSDYFLTWRQACDQFRQMGLRFFNGNRLIHSSFSLSRLFSAFRASKRVLTSRRA